jgi:hypothetical protein
VFSILSWSKFRVATLEKALSACVSDFQKKGGKAKKEDFPASFVKVSACGKPATSEPPETA